MWWGDAECVGACPGDGVLPLLPCVIALIGVVVAVHLFVRWADTTNQLRHVTVPDPSTPAEQCGTLAGEGEGVR
jgi:hypothetical protein